MLATRFLLINNRINVTFIDKDGAEIKLQVAEGDNLLDIAQANDLEMEGMSSCAGKRRHAARY